MAGSVNKVILIGNLGQDPELRYTANQTAVATLNIATTEYRSSQDGQKQELTEWHRVVVWNKLAENCSKYLAKGRTVYIEGRLQTRSWDDKTSGQKRYTTEVVAQNIQFLGGPSANRDSGASRSNDNPYQGGNNNNSLPDFDLGPASGGSSQSSSNDSSLMDDIPF